jgi:hypothetical protein
MSKSLKNFITIKELLQGDTTSPFSSKADDFRIWCLGMSGSYRAPTTYSEVRLIEASRARQKIVRFLVNGETWLTKASETNIQQWNEHDRALLLKANATASICINALCNDLDGITFVQELVILASAGQALIDSRASVQGASEPVRATLQTLRELCTLVGLSGITCDAGISSRTKSSSLLVGGENALLDIVVSFRSAVRKIAIDAMRTNEADDKDALKEILRLSDSLRDKNFPSLGVKLLDGSTTGQEGRSELKWTYCVPLEPANEESNKKDDARKCAKERRARFDTIVDISLDEFFMQGEYEGMFASFDASGLPLTSKDGNAISKNQSKKLRKKYEQHARHLELSISNRDAKSQKTSSSRSNVR